MLTPNGSSRAPSLAFISSRVLLVVTAFLVLTRFPVHTIEPWQTQIFPGNHWIDGWVRWDAFWYESIVDDTARFLPQDHSNANFFPFYAWASWLFASPFRLFLDNARAFFLGALLLSHLTFLCALAGVFRVAATIAGRDAAARTVWLMAFFPFSFFFSAVYSDALYLCLSVWTFRLSQQERWTLASVLAVMATLTRITGFVLIVALAVEFARRHPIDRRSFHAYLAPAVIVLLAPTILAIYFWSRYGDPIAFVHARQIGWHRATGAAALLNDFHYYTEGSLFSCGGVVECLRGWDFTRKLMGIWYIALVPIGLGLTLAARRTLGPGLVLWVAGSYAMALLNGLDGMGRFTAVLFPVFIALAIVVRGRVAVVSICAACIPFLLLFLGGFVRWRAVL